MQSKLVPLLAIVLTGIIARAQDTLTLDRCLALARSNSPALRAADDAIRASSLASSQISRSALPQLKAVAGTIYAPESIQFGYDPAITNGGQVAGQLVLQQSLYDGGLRSIKSDQYDLDAERLLHERSRTDRDLTCAVQQAYIEVLRSQREIELQEQSVTQDSSYLNLVQRFYASGNAAYTDVLKTEVQLSSARIALQKSIESFRTALNAITELIGAQLDPGLTISGHLEDVVDGRSDTLTSGLGENLDLRIADLTIARTALEVDLTRHERYPTITAFGDAGYLSSIDNYRLPSSDRVKAIGYSVGIGVELPLLNWGATGLQAEQRGLEVDALRQQTELLRRSLTRDLSNTRLALFNARARLSALHANVAKAEENFLLTRSRFAGGAALSLEVLSARQLLTETKIDELETVASIQLLAAKLHQLTTPSYAH